MAKRLPVGAEVEVERQLPPRLALSNPNRFLVKGWAAGRSRLKRVWVTVGEMVFRASEVESFRPDIMQRYAEITPCYLYLLSGWTVPVVLQPVSERRELDVELTIQFRDGVSIVKPLGTLTLEPCAAREHPAVLPPGVSSENLLVICMASYNPDLERFRRQVDSLSAQDFTNWICLVSDDASDPDLRAAMREVLARDPRFVWIENEDHVGFYHNFERCLYGVPRRAAWVALADHDDAWYPHKLSACLARLTGSTQLVYCDMRIVSPSGRVHASTYWTWRTNHYRTEDIDLLGVANTVTGAACVFRRELLDKALPFPPRYGNVYHDHWLAVLAAASGGIDYVAEPLYDYVQSEERVIGHYDSAGRTLREFWGVLRQRYRPDARPGRSLAWNAFGHAVDLLKIFYLFREGAAEGMWTVLETAPLRLPPSAALKRLRRGLSLWGAWRIKRKARRCGRRLSRLEDFLILSHVAWLGYRAFLRLAPSWIVRPSRYIRRLRGRDPALTDFKRKFSGRVFEASRERAPCVNVVTSALEPHLLFAGYLAVLNVAKRFWELGHRVRILLTDQRELSRGTRAGLLGHDVRLREFLKAVEIAPCPSVGHRVAISREDIFMATSWWTAYIAQEALAQTVYRKFIFLEQDYEPIFYANSSWRVMAEQCYRLSFFPIFSTDILQRFLVESGVIEGDRAGVFFRNPVLRFEVPDACKLETRRPRRLLFYARPGEHHARNLYSIGLAALDLAAERGALEAPDWEVLAIGGELGQQILPSGLRIRHLGVMTVDRYAELLAQCDVGLALMCSPHPGLLAIEMAAAGMLAVTNTYGIKDQAYFGGISRNITAVEASPEALAGALAAAARQAGDAEARIVGSRVNWPHDWKEALPDEILSRALQAVWESRLREQPSLTPAL